MTTRAFRGEPPVKSIPRLLMLVATLALASCGGGDPVPASVGAALTQSSPLQADTVACAMGDNTAAWVDGRCLKRFTELDQPKPAAATSLAEAPQSAQMPQATTEEITFFSWVERTYGSLFPGGYVAGTEGIFTYRYYAATGNFVAVAGGGVYILGPVSGNAIQYVGPMSTFMCMISSSYCTIGSGGSTGGGSSASLSIPGSYRSTDAVGNRNVSVYLAAGSTYVFDLEGAPSSQGTLSDPILHLYGPQGTEVASNDDAVGTLNSRIVYSAASSGTYRLAVSGYSGGNGTYLLTGGYSGTGGSGSTGGGSTSGGSSSGGSSGYITWTGSVNGTIIKDANNENYQVRATDRVVIDPSNSALTGLTVNSSAQVLRNGANIGYVGSLPSSSGSGNVAVFFCSNGNRLDISTTSTSWDHSCGSTSGGGTGGGSTGGGAVGGGGSSGGSSRGFYTWTGNANGEVVLDSTDERFRFYSDNGCIYSDNTRTEYTNFCLSGGSTVRFSGSTYTVTKVRSTTGSCIAGLLTSDGYFADIYTSSGRVEYITRGSRRPASC